MSTITREQVEHIANLARLEIKEEEISTYAEKLESIVTLVENLSNVNTENIKPTYHVLDLVNVFREDVAKEGLNRKEVLKNSYEQESGQFKVPTIIE
ncbi:Asp-tRNA(Asn)/Glu-tRNA(Gln) amidotransferase subunit GatC [Gemelliphila palaticanis]|uniref:Aspartyl/glutamyl-tRNA(Asn/Gln) amidotransferase subunit C n=1 Tax=Gemelliphila palaticanis TaxID=81950 RepID=A0ABX2T0F2_9BACL|nr:Asp-tRNA(Asn)/Glu-tRNA(Gln) amidotransferase subunit GatC [Gemella palaticanis]MBF0716196.1 Asp-tRNA(Asn)/Glu-tRNA(Gln) amidotransferase subunit GatC [Gemella palaticanis]NYS48126.1 Asp-tRNA(Asn)/Glu-tRNA(Gln) amidotransferase subunit GatC [Gemella palaticanis]